MSSADQFKDEIVRVRREAIELHAPSQVQLAIGQLAQQLRHDYRDRFPLFLTIMNGGMVFAGQLVTHLDFPLEMDYLHASRYQGETAGGEVQWTVTPGANLAGRDVLIIDDILDVGSTLLAIIEACKAQGAASVKTCVLVDKRHDRKARAGLEADYTGLQTGDYYLFGMGMDYKGYWRNSPGIYAVQPDELIAQEQG